VTIPSAPPVRLDHAAIRRIFIGLMLAMFLSALDQTIVATALATIGRAYANVENLTWVVTAYLLAATVVTPLYGKLSDIYGRRRVLLIGIAIFIIGSVACALSPSMPILVAARAVQGLGGGGLIALSQTIVGDAVSPRERGHYQGYFGAVFAISSIAGPVLGGVFAEHLHWSLIFWINVPLGLHALAITGRALKALPRHERPHQIDFLGAALMVTATVCLLLALNWGGTRYPWMSNHILGLLAAAAILSALFVARIATAAEPFVPLSIMRNRVVAAAIGCACLAYGTMIALTIYAPVYFEVVLGQSASGAGLTLIPFMGGVVIGSTFGGRMMAGSGTTSGSAFTDCRSRPLRCCRSWRSRRSFRSRRWRRCCWWRAQGLERCFRSPPSRCRMRSFPGSSAPRPASSISCARWRALCWLRFTGHSCSAASVSKAAARMVSRWRRWSRRVVTPDRSPRISAGSSRRPPPASVCPGCC